MGKPDLSLFFQEHSYLKNQNALAVAVSGGPDSMALAHMMVAWAQDNNKALHFLTVDHGLRTKAKEEAQMVSGWVQEQNNSALCHSILQWQGDKPETSIMEQARAARYQLMAEYCDHHKIQSLFLAHHQDDQAETFLIRLSKGSGLDGLAAMNVFRSYNDALTLVRPLLHFSKQDLIDCCDQYKVPYAEDPSNEDVDYLRPRLRQSMTVLSEEGLNSKRLAVTAKRLGRARQALEEMSAEAFDSNLIEKGEDHIALNFAGLQQHPEEISLRVIQKALEAMRPDADYNTRMEKMEELFHSLWHDSESFKPRTLGGCVFSLKDKNKVLWMKKEKS